MLLKALILSKGRPSRRQRTPPLKLGRDGGLTFPGNPSDSRQTFAKKVGPGPLCVGALPHD
jgi:hypothetical protein